MKREIIKTDDGSVTIKLEGLDETYHSTFGAIQEARHVYINNGLDFFKGQPVAVLEIGFGTGLNCFMTFLEAATKNQKIKYTGIEAYPVTSEEVLQLNYVKELNAESYREIFATLHSSEWEKALTINANFSLIKRQQFFQDISDNNVYDLIYFDAFGYPTQPELWSPEIFRKMYTALKDGGILITYACRGVIKRAMQEAGFTTEKLEGPPGKREILRAYKY